LIPDLPPAKIRKLSLASVVGMAAGAVSQHSMTSRPWHGISRTSVPATPLRRRRDQALHLTRRQVDRAIGGLTSPLTRQSGSHQPPEPSSVARSSPHEPHHGQPH
jgi:hypothetical protein